MGVLSDEAAQAWLAAIVASSDDAIIGKTTDGQIISWNAGAERLYGYSATEAIGRPIRLVIPAARQGEEQRILDQVLAGNGIDHYETQRQHKDGHVIPVSLSVSPIRDGTGAVVGAAAIGRDISSRMRSERRLLAQYAVSGLLAEGGSLGAVGERILGVLADRMDWAFANLWLGDGDGSRLRFLASWESAVAESGSFLSASRELALPFGYGLPGRAAEGGQPLWVADLAGDDNFARSEAAAASGFCSGCALPIIVAGRVEAVFEFFSLDRREPDDEAIAMLSATGKQIGQFVEQRNAERGRRESEGRAAAILASALDTIITIDHEGRVVEFNAAAEETFGYARDEVLGRELAELIIPAEHREAHRAGIARYLATGEGPVLGRRIELTGMRADGSEFPTELTVVPVDAPGRPLFTGYLRDLTEQRAAQEALRRSVQQYRQLFDAHPVPMWVYDLETLRFLAINDAAVRHYSHSREQFLEMTIADIRPPEDVDTMVAAVQRVSDGLTSSGPWRHQKRDGTVIHVEINSHRTTFDGRSAEVVLAADITERERLRAELGQAQKLEAIGQLAGGIAHDFNNIATVIGAHSRALVERLTDEQDQTRAAEISKAADHAASLTRQLLAFSRRQLLAPQELDLATTVESMLPFLTSLAGAAVRIEPVLSPGTRIWADPDQVIQVLTNLVANARDAMPAGGVIRIETTSIDLQRGMKEERLELQPGRYGRLIVSDDGQGMDAATKSRIFEPFFTTKDTASGTGLGLATVYGIAKQSGGGVWVYSEPDKGTTFKVYLPMMRTQQPSESPPTVPTTLRRGSETILFVEDHEQIRTLVHTALEQLGYTVLVAAHGGEALAIAQAHRREIDLLVTDVVMPGITGTEVADALRTQRPQIAVVYTSGYARGSLGSTPLGPTARYLQKPYGLSDLATVVREVLDAATRVTGSP